MNLSNINNVNATSSTTSDSSLVDRSSASSSFEQLLATYNTNNKTTTPTNTNNASTSTNANANTTSNNTSANNTSANSSSANNEATSTNNTETASATTKEGSKSEEAANTETAQQSAETLADVATEVVVTKPIVLVAHSGGKSGVDKSKDTEDTSDLSAADIIDAAAADAEDVAALTPATTDTQAADTVVGTEPDAATQSLLAMLTQPQLLPVENTSTTAITLPSIDTAALASATGIADDSVVTNPLQAAESDAVQSATSGFTLNTKADDATVGTRASQDSSADSKITSKDTSNTSAATTVAASTPVHTDNASTTQSVNAALTNATLQATPLAQATTTASATAAASTTPQLTAQVGTEAWQQSLGQQIVMFNKDGQYSAKLRLHPEELGSLQISMTMTDNQAQLHFVSAHSQVRAALEAAMPYLRTSLAENGIDLGQASVGSESAQSGEQQSGSSQTASRFDYLDGGSDGNGDLLSVPASLQRVAANASGIDIFA